ncbi:MAG: amino acid adenylation domain-containing protein [Methylococcales bacterium]|nr:amino acid adenylation domain-containing protein [Methylococcales bacterium]
MTQQNSNSENSTREKLDYEPIAIVGMGCRFPGGANDPYQFWDNIKDGVDCLEPTPKSRWNTETYFSKVKGKKGKINTRWGGYIDGLDEFDPLFFGISPREADYMDPQQRKLLEVTWEAIEEGGLKPSELSGKAVGVYIGGFTLDYKILQFTNPNFNNIDAHTATGVMMTMLSNRISYIYNLKGPSLTVDTACSSSLVSIDLACRSLQQGDSEIALAGGVLANFAPQYTVSESQGGFLSPTGSSHALSDTANGYVRSEGVGVFVLKKLSQAEADGDNIHAVILGSAVNQDGRTHGITVPSSEAQLNLMKTAYKRANVSPGKIQYIEIHGTGTPVGDPIEAESVGNLLNIDRHSDDSCFIGSVKTNIGHTEAAAGSAGIIKTVMALKHQQIPPHLHFVNPNPAIAFDQYPYAIPTTLTPWPKHEGLALAGVNSFGFGGTNAHIVLQEYQPTPKAEISVTQQPKLLVISHNDKNSLIRQAQAYETHIQGLKDETELYHLAYSSACVREQHAYKVAFIYNGKEQLLSRLADYTAEKSNEGVFVEQTQTEQSNLVWVFTGMGPQWWGMGHELYKTEPVYRETLDKIDDEFSKWVDWSLKDELFTSEDQSKMAETWLAQTANFAVQVALAELWKSYGIQPKAIVGHSTGEVAAFYLAGVYSLEDAVKIVIHRSRLQHLTRGMGKMLAVGLSEQAVMPYLAPHEPNVSIGAINSPGAVTLTGDADALGNIAQQLQAQEIFNKFLRVEVPYHSVIMEKIKDELFESLADLSPQVAHTDLYSTVTGEKITGEEGDAEYWWRNVREPVAFAKAISAIFIDDFQYFLEIGPHPVLAASIGEIATSLEAESRVLYSIRRKFPEQTDFYGVLASLNGLGFQLDWNTMYPNGHFVRMPRYQWRQDKHWYETPFYQTLRQGEVHQPLLGVKNAQTYNLWDSDVSLEKYPYLNDHVIQDSCLFPAAGYIEMIYAALNQHWGAGFYSIDNLRIDKGVFLSDDKNPDLKLVIDEPQSKLKIISRSVAMDTESSNDPLVQEDQHISGFIRSRGVKHLAPAINLDSKRNNSHKSIDKETCYGLLAQFDYQYGHHFQSIETAYLSENQVLAKIVLSSKLDSAGYHLHPALLDACLQTLLINEIEGLSAPEDFVVRLPIAINEININAEIGDQFWCLTEIISRDEEKIIGNLSLCNDQGEVLGVLKGFNAQAVDSVAGGMNTNTIDSWLYQTQWMEQELGEINTLALKKAYLIFADDGGIAETLTEKLRGKGSAVCLVNSAQAYSMATDFNRASLRTNNFSQLGQCVHDFYQQYGADSGIIHCLGLDATPSFDEMGARELEQLKKMRLHSLLLLSKVIVETEIKGKLWILSSNGHVVTEDAENLNAIAASMIGISRVLAQHELCENWGAHIDLDSESNSDNVILELGLDSEEEISYRQQRRYSNRLVAPETLKRPFPVHLKTDACYLVAGGFGAIGHLVCKLLIHRGARRLLLITRSAFPKRETWQHIDSDHRLYERIKFIKELEAMGAEVILADIDVTQDRELRYYFDDFAQRGYPPIRGVFFCTGVVKDTLISAMETDDFDEVYDTKTIGALTLHQCLKKAPLDYFVLFSSIAAQVTTAGQVNYASANSFLDALAHYRCSQGLPALSINWGPWAIGMIKELGLGHHYKEQRGMPPILPDAGIKVLERILTLPNPQLSVCDAQWNKVLAWYPKKPHLFKELVTKDERDEDAGDFLSCYLNCEANERKNLVETEFKTLVATILRTDIANLNATDTLVALGIDSIMGVELNNRLLGHFGERLSVVKLLGNLNITQLAAELNEKIILLAASKTKAIANEVSLDVGVETDDNCLCTNATSCNAEIEDEYPLSFGQKAIWFTHQLNPLSAAYNIGGVMHIPSVLKLDILDKAINGVVQRHPGLRANFYVVEGEPVQRIYAHRPFEFTVVDVANQDWESIRQQVIEDNQHPFDLENDSLLRIRLYRQAEDSYYFAITIYHIVSDAWSNYKFLNEMQDLYARYLKEETIKIERPKASYRDFVEWESRLINSIRGSGLYKFWRNRLPENIPQLALETDKKRPLVMTNNGASYNFEINADLTKQLQTLARNEGATMFMALLSLYYTLMHKYTQQNDIIIGSPVAGRTQAEFAEVYGYFVNPLPLWVNFDQNPNFVTLLKDVRETTLMGLENQEFPFSLLVDRLEIEHDPSRTAIFQVMFVLLNHQVDRTHIDENNVAHYDGFPMQLLQMPEEEGQFDITLSVYEEKGVYYATFKYNTDLFVESTIVRMAEHFLEIAKQAVATPQTAVSTYHLPTPNEQTLLKQWSGVETQAAPIDRQNFISVHQTIEGIAQTAANQMAVQMTNDSGESDGITYAQLNADANQMAHALKAEGVNHGDVVGLYLKKSPKLIIALLACLKVGASYLVLDGDLPIERLKQMLEISATSCLLKASHAVDTSTLEIKAYAVDELGSDHSKENLNLTLSPEQGAYIVFTSGSTGRPKAVLVTQENIATMATAWKNQYTLENTHVHLQMAHISFDVFCGDWIRALSNGKTLQLCPRNSVLNMPLLLETIETNQVDFAEFVPTVIRKLVSYAQQKGKKLPFKMLVIASERWTLEDYHALLTVTDARIFNSYGTSETTIDSTFFEVTTDSIASLHDLSEGIPIGRPFENNTVYVLDNTLNPVPVGIVGELYIGGSGVCKGYVNESEQTEALFIPDPFNRESEQYLYKTGDIVKWDEQGQLHFLGRKDTQVKVRGHRIELSEIENTVLAYQNIEQAVIVIQNNATQEPCLCAYYQVMADTTVDENNLQRHIAEHLPSYMMPEFFQQIDKLPELDNGKVNLNALPKPQRISSSNFQAPETLYEIKMAEIWGKMLGTQSVGVYDDFFELGGNSLYLIELMIQIQDVFNIKITVNQLFKLSTLAGMSKTVEEVITGKIEGALPYICYNEQPNNPQYLFSFPPAGGYSIVYETLAAHLPPHSLLSFNYLTDEDKISQYASLISGLQPQGDIKLFGYSLGGNLAFEVGVELEKQGRQVSDIIIMDSYRIVDDLTISDELLTDFKMELREHFKKHTGSDKVEEHTMAQANNYIDFSYQQKNLQLTNAAVHYIVENNDADPHRENKLKSWEGSSKTQTELYVGTGRHEDMLLGENAKIHADLIQTILKKI